MKLNKFSLTLLIAFALFSVFSVAAQDEVFSDSSVDYSFSVPEAKWKMTVKPSATSPNVEYVYGDRFDGHLEVRKLTIPKDSIMTDIIRDEEQKLQFKPGFVAGKEENFSGKLRGAVLNFDFVASGRNMTGRFYFLKANETTVYVLRFSGQKDSIRSLRNQTDAFARSFAVKGS